VGQAWSRDPVILWQLHTIAVPLEAF